MTRSRYALMLFITILFGLIAGLLLSYPLRYAFSLDWPFDTGYIPDVKLFFRWRAIAGWSLLTISLAYAVFNFQRILRTQKPSTPTPATPAPPPTPNPKQRWSLR